MSVTIKEVNSKKELKQFINFYTHLYHKNKQVAFPLIMDEMSTLRRDKNPAHQFCQCRYWVACRNNEIVGRIAAIINQKEQEKQQEPIGRFGWFDFKDDVEISSALFNTAMEWLSSHGVTKMHGPMGFTDMDRQGLLIQGYELPGTMATLYNYPYYEKHFAQLGLTKSTDWIEFELQTDPQATRLLTQLAQRALQYNGLQSLKMKSAKQLKQLAPDIFHLINDAYKDLYGYIPLTRDQINYYTKAYLDFVNLKLISVVVDEAGKLVGVGISMPSFTQALQKTKGKLFPFGFMHLLKALKKNDKLDLYLIAVADAYQNKGVTAIIMSDIANGAAELGIHTAETNIELEDNHQVQAMWRFLPNKQHKRRRCYIKSLKHD
ncbi:hypothetical protein DMA11_02805 [Marinilabiliaceae bacterium JC017]|nr:hypothetical protein DMA11_02805 [Marinilabiliaceae bacterium JC017]